MRSRLLPYHQSLSSPSMFECQQVLTTKQMEERGRLVEELC